MFPKSLIPLYALLLLNSGSLAKAASCTPFHTRFGDHAALDETHFRIVDGPNGYDLTPAGLRLMLYKPEGSVRTEGNVNDKIGQGVTVTSDWDFTYAIWLARCQ
jgi:hypothetical protein